METIEKQNLKQKLYETYKEKILPRLIKIEDTRLFLLKSKDSKRYKKIAKQICLNDLLDCIGFIKQGTESGYSVYNSNLVYEYISSENLTTKIDDEFYGNYKDVRFNITEIRNCLIQTKYESLKNCRGLWNGIVINMEYNKQIYHNTYIFPKSDKTHFILLIILYIIPLLLIFFLSSLGILASSNWFDGIFTAILSGLLFVGFIIIFIMLRKNLGKKVNLEDISFDKKYKIISENQLEARYILTPAFMERLNKLKTVLSAREIWCRFVENQVTMAFETDHDMFEFVDLYTVPTKDPKQIEKFFEEIIAITDIIDHFKLNEKTGL